MARVNVYLPGELAERARAAGVNVSAAARRALEEELAARAAVGWLDRVARLAPTAVQHEDVEEAVSAARADFDRDG